MTPTIIGNATLYCGDCREIIPTLPNVDAVIVDPPYSERCHSGHDSTAGKGKDGSDRKALGYSCLTPADVEYFAKAYADICTGWIVWMTDSDLALKVRESLELDGRTTFPPLPFFHPGSTIRISGDGPSSWTTWICVARTKRQIKWGTLTGGYVAGSGWNDKARMGGKPTHLMSALVADYSKPGQLVLDTHMGAGTTGVACVQAGRRFIGCEIDPEAFELSCQRIDNAQRQESLFSPSIKQEQIGLAL